MPPLRIPPAFAARAPRVLGPESAPWLAELPSLAQRFAREWGLEFEDRARHGFAGVVQPARRADGSRVMLKLGWPHEESQDEPLALSTWAGHGAVLLLESAPEHGVLLWSGWTIPAPCMVNRCCPRSRCSASWPAGSRCPPRPS